MAECRSDKSPYQSAYGGGWVSSGQWIAEFVMARQAAKNKTELPQRFWMAPPWKGPYLGQLMLANRLLKNYSATAIMRALRSKRGALAFSLNAVFLKDLIKKEQELESVQRAAVVEAPTFSDKLEAPRPTYARKKSVLDLLRTIDGEES